MSFRHSTGPVPPSIHARRRRRARLAAGAAVGALLLTGLIATPSYAAHPEVSLTGSDFEIDTDANLEVDDAAPSIDWASVGEIRQTDAESGSGDDSFGQGSKEDTLVPTVVDGSIPPNKSDLLHFGFYLEEAAGGDFLHLFWHRVQDPSGTTNMDFEFNKSETISANGVTPVRSAGDLLIQYDLANGGTQPELFLSRWVETGNKALCEAANATPCWGDRVNLSGLGDATGSINTSPIPSADSDGLGDVSARTFGEATIDFSVVAGEGCVSFGSAYLKSRSSDSFTAAMKDFIAPVPTDLDNCGALKIVKTAKHAAAGPGDHPQADVTFTVSGGSLTEDVELVTDENGEACLSGIEAGDYTVTETVPTGYTVTSDNPQTATVVENSTCEDADPVVFTNDPLTNITVTVDSQVVGGTFSSIECGYTTDDPDVDFNADASDSGDSSLAMTDLVPGTYTCVIVVDP